MIALPLSVGHLSLKSKFCGRNICVLAESGPLDDRIIAGGKGGMFLAIGCAVGMGKCKKMLFVEKNLHFFIDKGHNIVEYQIELTFE